ncbi:hypothetical protein [Bandra megavirus]|uniref:CDC123-like protein n=1 Tax=Bandra megavirus TaxID=2071566 RepID=A0A2K9V775_9VIRU|nr:hypothetical protein [Bandra megavirus]
MDIIILPYVKISEHDNYTVYQYPKNYLELFLDELFYDNSIEVTDDFTFKISINGFILNKVNIESMIDFEYLRQKQIATYWVSEWYDYLIENVPNTMITFKSKLIRLTDNDIADLSKFKINNIIPDSLAKKITKTISKMSCSCFIRTDAYSPKDLLHREIIDTLEVTDAITALKLITQSERCSSKLFGGDNKIFSKYIVVREYVNYDTNYEFRCFVYNWRLTAISQSGFEYNLELHSKKNTIYQSIIKFWDKFGRICPYSECTMDIIYNDKWIDNTLNNSGIVIIEFNSFGEHMNASSGLYDWTKDHSILTRSKTPHFLLAEKPLNVL